MDGRGRELITTDEATFIAKSFLDPIVMESGQGDTGFPDPSSTDECDWMKVFGELYNPLDYLITAEE